MPRRRLFIPLALVGAVGISLTPTLASASTPTHAATTHATLEGDATSSSLAKAAGFKTYTSSAGKSVRVQQAAEAAMKGFATSKAKASSRTSDTSSSSGATIYTSTASATCGGEPAGNGTAASPYCSVQDAVDAAVPGDVIEVEGSAGAAQWAAITITTSDLTIVGVSTQSWISGSQVTPTLPAITLDGVSNVTITNMMVSNRDAPDVAIENSTGVTLEDDYLGGGGVSDLRQDSVSIDGASSDVTISRSYLDTNGWSPDYAAVSIASGAKNIVVASDLIAASGILATGVTGLDVVGDTIQRGCSSGIDIEGDSTGVYLENNVLEDADPSMDQQMGGYQSQCTSDGDSWAPDVNVAAGSTTSTTTGYNDFDVYGSDATDPYGWGGTDYASIAAYQSATAEGAHDTNDTTVFTGDYLRDNEAITIAFNPSASSPAVGSANPDAPGEPSSDFYGVSPYTTRGAVQYSQNNVAGVSLSVTDSSAFGVTATATVTGWTEAGLEVEFDWDDAQFSFTNTSVSGDTITFSHSYAELGTYAVSVSVSNGAGLLVVNNLTNVSLAGSEYTAYGPSRILDTRNGTGAAAKAVPAGEVLPLQVVGAGISGDTIPAGITAVVLNVTVTEPTANGFLTVFGDENQAGTPQPVPDTSNINFRTGQNVPNLVVVPVGANGVVDFYNGSPTGSTDIIADVAGYFWQNISSRYVPVDPTRILDTRKGIGTGAVAKIPANGSITLTVDGSGSGAVPSSDVTAVALNLTAVDSARNGVITAYPAGEALPTVSNVNYSTGQTAANMAIVPVGTNGQVVFHNNSTGPVDLIADVFGYYTSTGAAGSSAYLPLSAPERILDTRKGGPLQSGKPDPVPFSTAAYDTAAVLNATVTAPTGNGFLSVYPFNPNEPGAVPTTSNLNYLTNQTVPNLVIASPGTVEDEQNGTYDLGLYLGGKGTAQVILDWFGVFQDQ